MSHRVFIIRSVGVSMWGLLLLCAVTWASEPIIVELEASMHSTLLLDIQSSVSRVATAQSSGVSDTVAVVGQMFWMRIPLPSADCHSTDIFSEVGSAPFPSWLYWDNELCLLQGLPLEGDKGLYRFSLSPAALQGRDGSIQSHLLLRGTKLNSAYTHINQPEVFTITVNSEDQQEIDPAPLTRHTEINATAVCVCSSGQPITVLTIILDADLIKMNSRERLALLQKMSHFASVPPELMRVMPVINNRFFDMTAFMAGPGNAKKVVENGALLSWKLGCALDQSNLPDISRVQLPAKDGTMSALLGYPVVGWYIVNKKPQVVKRIRRQIHNTPTPVPSQLPPTTHPEPAERIVPTLTSPFIAPTTDMLANPARGPLPLPVKPTIRIRDQVAYTPVLGHPLPTRVLGSTSTLPIQPTLTRHGYVEPTASVTPPTTRRPKTSATKKGKKQKTTPMPREPKTTVKPSRRTTPVTNQKPQLHNPIDEVNVWVGTYFEVKIPADTFFDQEDGSTERLRLSLRQSHNQAVDEGSWIQFNSTSQLLYGLPDLSHVGRHEFFMMATDKEDTSTTDAFEVHVNRWPAEDQSPVTFTARFQGEPSALSGDIHKKILLSKKLAFALGDRNSSSVTLRNISNGSILVEWTNSSLPKNPCPREQIQAMCRRISDAQGQPTPIFNSAMEPEFKPINISVRGANKCQRFSFVPPGELPIPPSTGESPTLVPTSVTPSSGSGRRSSDDVYLHTVIPAVVVAALLLTAGFIAMVCYRKKRRGKLTTEEQATFIKKGVPIIFADELDDSKSPPSSSMPLILREEKPPLPPPQYPSSACGEGSLLNHHMLEEYISLSDDDPSAPPYQPPPPFTVPIEGKGSRPKNMTSYRCPPPYVPP
ncbi:dystroglycan 1-like [Astyanax mexicanus]|uniref:dystroglycan 1-like n=1 Tax=Astyanax mexicanus TaxID=7994 RepID=UPI0020CB547F|nr:dystroglycan 1-like [Astyanax mexicanus]XP_049342061.1 dystroglycan 1-like [Astyanax mexicanus]XP_049342062.1 dystroglycan 1-like [Astyanax mexicanus]